MPEESRFRLGVLSRTFGLAGGLRCTPDTGSTPAIETPCEAWIGYSEAFAEAHRLERVEIRPDGLVCWFEGITTREQAELLSDRALFLPSHAVGFESPLADPKLFGYQVREEGTGRDLGAIAGMFKTAAQQIWTIVTDDREWMLPAIDEFVVEIRHEERIAIVRLIPGMFDDEGDEGRDGE